VNATFRGVGAGFAGTERDERIDERTRTEPGA
jgi:hypothetical protein